MFLPKERKQQGEKTMKKILISILLLGIVGCASTGTFTDPEGNVWTAEVTGNAKASMETKDLTLKVERKPLIQIPSVNDLKIGGNDD